MTSPIPMHAVRKQAELCLGLLCDLELAVARGQPLDQQLSQYYRRHREFGSRDRRFFSALAFAWFRWRGWLPTMPSQPDALNYVLAWLLDAPERHPAIEWLASQLPPFLISPHPLGNMPVKEKARIMGQWLQRPPPELDALVPAWFADALFYPSGADRTAHQHCCLQALQVRPPTWLRIRTGHERAMLEFLQHQNMPATPHPRRLQAVSLPGGHNLENLKTMADVEIQDLASQGVGLVCAPGAGESWWDACAGSGGKSFHLADLMQATGSIMATDTRPGILKECRRRLIRTRLHTITLRNWNGTAATAPDRLFNGVLVDAPCSGLGTWHRNPDARWRIAPDAVPRYTALQSELLKICADRVHSGGRLVYAVCTLTGAETVGVIESFLAGRRDFSLESTPHPLTGEATVGLIWIWPWEGNCNGMFIARMKKNG